MPTPKLDTSPAAVAEVLRNCADSLSYVLGESIQIASIRALADALERQGETPWSERVDRAVDALHDTNIPVAGPRYTAIALLCAAFPEFAPKPAQPND